MDQGAGDSIPPSKLLIAAGGAALVIGAIWALGGDAPAPRASEAAAPQAASQAHFEAELSALRAGFEHERAARRRLEREIAELRAQLTGASAADAADADREGDDTQGDERERARPARKRRPGLFDPDALVAAGVAPRDADGLRALWEAVEMEKIRLGNEARRDGWADSPRYHEEIAELDIALREDLGPPGYDRYLYATGRHNRTQVVDVFAQSPGAEAGFAVGDVILSYDGERIFGVGDLSELASSGRAGGSVRVEVMRGGSIAVLDVPRGPLGLMVVPHRAPPP